MGYSVLLPTADFVNAAVTSVPYYDAQLFLNEISQAINGNPYGLINAVGDPIAADIALFAIATGFEAIVLTNAARSIIDDFASLQRLSAISATRPGRRCRTTSPGCPRCRRPR
ncbi:hypothetical protein LAUMK13_02520 [Mycobacterium innocens]|uniref:Uncharacterized protein n=1 Tax=Mycobacterium innocens TaxID=2341083 RepID=A0A498Q4L1_9MYCO|nr:hypothetical protein LAUMK13_02520 [Mycobacterium innocens]